MTHYSIRTNITIDNFESFVDHISCDLYNRIMIVSSKTIITFPSVQRFINNLSSKGATVSVAKISAEAPLSELENISRSEQSPDLIIGIGGGSVMDSAKALSLGWKKNSLTELLYKTAPIPKVRKPLFLVPTTAGTGSELSYGAIVYDDIKKFKGGIRSSILVPDEVLINIELYQEAPKLLKAEVGFDCLTHAVETYISKRSTDLVRMQSVFTIVTLMHHLEKAVNGSEHSMKKVALSATMMGSNLAFSTTCLPHRLQYTFGPETKTSHAQGLIALYKGWLPVIKQTDEYQRLEKDLSQFNIVLETGVNQLKQQLGIDYSLSSFGVKEEDIYRFATSALGNLDVDPSYEGEKTLIQIIKGSL